MAYKICQNHFKFLPNFAKSGHTGPGPVQQLILRKRFNAFLHSSKFQIKARFFPRTLAHISWSEIRLDDLNTDVAATAFRFKGFAGSLDG